MESKYKKLNAVLILHEHNCECRKPKPKFLNEIINKYNIEPKSSWFVGDKTSDMQCGINANVANTIFIGDKSNKIATYSFNKFNLENMQSIL